mgnify:CR=1 FL=1
MRDGQHEIVAAARCVHFAAQGQYRVGVAELAAYRDAQVELVQNRLQGIDQSGGGAVAGQGRYLGQALGGVAQAKAGDGAHRVGAGVAMGYAEMRGQRV